MLARISLKAGKLLGPRVEVDCTVGSSPGPVDGPLGDVLDAQPTSMTRPKAAVTIEMPTEVQVCSSFIVGPPWCSYLFFSFSGSICLTYVAEEHFGVTAVRAHIKVEVYELGTKMPEPPEHYQGVFTTTNVELLRSYRL